MRAEVTFGHWSQPGTDSLLWRINPGWAFKVNEQALNKYSEETYETTRNARVLCGRRPHSGPPRHPGRSAWRLRVRAIATSSDSAPGSEVFKDVGSKCGSRT